MSSPTINGLFCHVELNCNGVFLREPFSYVNGFTYTIDDHDFPSHTYVEFITWLKRYMQESFKKVYYCEPGKPLSEGIQLIENDVDYSGFDFEAYGTDGTISVYIDHEGVGLMEWFKDGDEAAIEEDEQDLGEVNEEVVADNEVLLREGVVAEGGFVKMNRT